MYSESYERQNFQKNWKLNQKRKKPVWLSWTKYNNHISSFRSIYFIYEKRKLFKHILEMRNCNHLNDWPKINCHCLHILHKKETVNLMRTHLIVFAISSKLVKKKTTRTAESKKKRSRWINQPSRSEHQVEGSRANLIVQNLSFHGNAVLISSFIRQWRWYTIRWVILFPF